MIISAFYFVSKSNLYYSFRQAPFCADLVNYDLLSTFIDSWQKPNSKHVIFIIYILPVAEAN